MPVHPAVISARERRIRRALRLLEARFGPGVAWRLADARHRFSSPTIPTGSLGLDLATGPDGYPRGQLVELFGPPSAGKATLLASALAAVQRRGGLVALIDVLGVADPDTLAGAGVDLDALIVAQPADAVDAVRCLALLAESAALDLLGLASIADLRAILPSGETGVPPAVTIGRLLSTGLRQVVQALLGYRFYGPGHHRFQGACNPGWPVVARRTEHGYRVTGSGE